MKIILLTILSIFAVASAFAPSQVAKPSTALHAEQSRKAFISAAALALIGSAAPAALAMDQVLVTDPTEQWETGKPTAKAESARMSRFSNARNQMNSNFPPIKRLKLERKSPTVRFSNLHVQFC